MKQASTGAWKLWLGRRWLLVAAGFLFLFCLSHLGLKLTHHTEGYDAWAGTIRFFQASVSPSFTDENPRLPADATPFLARLGEDLIRTIRYALIATAIAIPAGLVLGLLASSHWLPKFLRWPVRIFLSLLRSIHELIWAIFFLSAVGDAALSACLALAFPFAGTLAKVYSELIDEQKRSAHDLIRGAGGGRAQAFLSGIFPTALPDMITYSLYRFECALRSSAVLGFIGIETIGLTIHRSFENFYYGEVWTALYLLIGTILAIETFGSFIRRRLSQASSPKQTTEQNPTEETLRKSAPRDLPLRASALAWLSIIGLAFILGPSLVNSVPEGQRAERLSRFLTKLTPDPVAPSTQLASWSERLTAWKEGSQELMPWLANNWRNPGAEALGNTVIMAIAAVLIAGAGAFLLIPWACRNLASAQPMGLISGRGKIREMISLIIRGFFIVTRAVPEYLYAFLLVGLLGPSAWPLVLALALHNLGILGRLWSEVVENQPAGEARCVIQIGGSRLQCFLAALLPLSLNRFLLFFFYRWESCIREATVLGMLGISSLGYYISIQKNFRQYDDILFFTLLGAGAIILGDLLSDLIRRKLRIGRFDV